MVFHRGLLKAYGIFWLCLISVPFNTKGQCQEFSTPKDTIYVFVRNVQDYGDLTYSPDNFISEDTCYELRKKVTLASEEKPSDSLKIKGYTCQTYVYFIRKSNGKILAEGLHNSESFCGEFKIYFRNGAIKMIGFTHWGDIKCGTWKYYRRNGKLKSSVKYDSKGNKVNR